MKRISDFTATLAGAKTETAPLIHGYLPDNNPSHAALVVLAGGGYAGRSEREDARYAERFCREGLACFVVDYRLGSDGFRYPAMLEDALAAMGTVRRRADEFGVEADRIGIIGSSAGGHLAAHASLKWTDYPEGVALRPSFTVLCYPVISSDPAVTHAGSMCNLLGPEPTTERLNEVSLDEHVHDRVPPCYIWHTNDDDAVPVENSVRFAAVLRKAGIRHELHLYPSGAHGLALDAPFDWVSEVMGWLNGRVWVRPVS